MLFLEKPFKTANPTALVCPGTFNHNGNRLQQDIEVQPKGPVIDVPDVPFDQTGKRDVAAAPNLPESGDARPDLQALKLFEVLFLDLLDRKRSRTNKTHFSPQDINNLGQLIQTILPQELSHLGHARVFLNLENRTIHFVPGAQVALFLMGIDDHAPEFEHGKYFPRRP